MQYVVYLGVLSSCCLLFAQTYQDCSCVNGETLGKQQDVTEPSFWGTATSGPCLVDCTKEFYMFLLVVCILKFIGSSGRASNFLVSVR